MIICFLLQHYLQLLSLPEIQKEYFIRSDTNSCKEYSTTTWNIVERDNNKVVVSNGVIESEGYCYIRNNQNKRRDK